MKQPSSQVSLLTQADRVISEAAGQASDILKLLGAPVRQHSSHYAIANEDILWELGIGCSGKVDVLIERLTPDDLHNPLSLIEACINQRQTGVLATVFQSDSEIVTPIGSHLLHYPQGRIVHNLSDNVLQKQILKDIKTALLFGQSYGWTFARSIRSHSSSPLGT